MQKIVISTLLFSQMLCSVFAADFSVNKITSLKHPVWLQQGTLKTRPKNNQAIKPGDQITTGNKGLVEIQMGLSTTIFIYPESQISIQAKEVSKSTTNSQPMILLINKGKSCIFSKQAVEAGDMHDIKVGNSLVSAVSFNYEICVQRGRSSSSVYLIKGSIQITQNKKSDSFILSQPGIQLLIKDDGSFDLIASDSKDSAKTTVDKKPKNKTRNKSTGQPDTRVKAKPSLTQDEKTAKKINTSPAAGKSRQHYNVYLFSTLDKAEAEKVNQRFHNASLNSKIIIIERKGTSIYRIAVPDFQSLKEAQTFSRSVEGKLGISSTWIGHSEVLAE